MAKKTAVLLALSSLFCHTLLSIGVFAYFYVNQAYIAEELCINRFEPELSCKGKCFLDDMLSQVDGEKDNMPDQPYQLREIHLFFSIETPCIPHVSHLTVQSNKWLLTNQLNWYTFYRNSIFQPPRV